MLSALSIPAPDGIVAAVAAADASRAVLWAGSRGEMTFRPVQWNREGAEAPLASYLEESPAGFRNGQIFGCFARWTARSLRSSLLTPPLSLVVSPLMAKGREA